MQLPAVIPNNGSFDSGCVKRNTRFIFWELEAMHASSITNCVVLVFLRRRREIFHDVLCGAQIHDETMILFFCHKTRTLYPPPLFSTENEQSQYVPPPFDLPGVRRMRMVIAVSNGDLYDSIKCSSSTHTRLLLKTMYSIFVNQQDLLLPRGLCHVVAMMILLFRNFFSKRRQNLF